MPGPTGHPEAEMLDVINGLRKKRCDMVVVKRVQHMFPLPLPDDQSQMTKGAELVGHG